MDLLDYDHNQALYRPSYEDALRVAMQKQWAEDQRIIKQRREIPDWWGEPEPLARDKAAILGLLYEIGCFEWSDHPCRNNTQVAKALKLPIAHVKGKIDEMHKAGLITSSIEKGRKMFSMTQEGEYALSEYQRDKELGIL